MYFIPSFSQKQVWAAGGVDVYKPTIITLLHSSASGLSAFIRTYILTPSGVVILSLSFILFTTALLLIRHQGTVFGKANRVYLWLLAIAAPFSIWFSLIPGYYGYKEGAPERVLVTTVFWIIWLVFIAGLILAAYTDELTGFYKSLDITIKKSLIFLVACGLILVVYLAGSHHVLRKSFDSIKTDNSFHYEKTLGKKYDEREEMIYKDKKQNLYDIVVSPYFGSETFYDLTYNKDHWINKCTSWYYGINSIKLGQF